MSAYFAAETGQNESGRNEPGQDVVAAYSDILADVLGVAEVAPDAHWFTELGADSLMMARFCARVRSHPELPAISMRDVYATMTVDALATAVLDTTQSSTVVDEPRAGRASTVAYMFCGAAQLAIFLGYVAVVSSFASIGYDWVTGATNPLGYYLRSLAVGAVAFVGMSTAPILAKWVLIGRWREDSIEIWSLHYLRFWAVRTLIRTNPLMMLVVGSPLYNVYLRALGASIGRGTVILTRTVPMATDLLTIGARCIVRKDAILLGYRARGGRIETGRVTLGDDVLVSEATVLDIGSSMGSATQLGHQSSLHDGQHVPDGERWAGSPAARTTSDFSMPIAPVDNRLRRLRYTAGQLTMLLAVYLPAFIGGADVLVSMFPQAAEIAELDLSPTTSTFYLEALYIATVWFFGAFLGGLVVVAVVPRMLSPLVRPGTVYPLYGVHFTAARTIARLTTAKYYLYLFGDSSYVLGYLRWVGYRLRRVAQTGSNFGTAVKHENPFASSVGSGTMVADGLSLMNAEYTHTSFRISPVRIGSNSFLGNRIVYPPGGRVGDDCLLATKVMVPVDGSIRTGVGLLGSPSFEIPRTVDRDHQFDHWTRGIELHRRLTKKNRHNRTSMMLAVLARWAYFYGVTLLSTVAALGIPRFGALAFVGQALSFLVFTTLWFVLLERAGARFRRLRPLYCSIYHPDFWRHERYWKFVVPDWDRTLGGTPFKNVVSRMLGVRIGRRVFDDGCSVTERTLVTIGDDVTLNGYSVIQCHSQEDGAFKSGRVTLGARSTLGVGAFVHYETTVGPDARLEPDSFLMKGEVVPEGAVWGGNPAVSVRDRVPAAPPVLEPDHDDLALAHWTAVLQRGGVTSVPTWSLPGTDRGVETRTARLSPPVDDEIRLLAAHFAVLSAVTGQAEVTTAYLTGGVRVPLTVTVEDRSWRQLLSDVADAELLARTHAEYPLDDLRRRSALSGPVTDAAFGCPDELPPGAIIGVDHDAHDGLFRVSYRTEALDADAADRFGGYHLRALDWMASDLDADVRVSSLLSSEEVRRQRHDMTGPSWALPDHPIHELIQDRALRHPDLVAAECADQSWTYRRLDAVCNRLATRLVSDGVQPGDVVAVATVRNLGWLASVLAVLEVGAVYLPIEPHFPTDRIETILRQADARFVLVEGDGSDTVRDATERTLASITPIDADVSPMSPAEEAEWAAQRPNVAVPLDSPAYIYFTSGSTGRPKGAMCAHSGMVNHVVAKISDLSISGGAVVAQTAPQCFDISLWQLVAALVVGGRTVIVEQDVILDVEQFVDCITDAEVSVMQVVPSYLDVVLDYLESNPRPLPHLRCVSVTGEAVKKDLTERFFGQLSGITLVNAYGLTETSDDTNHEVMHSVPSRDRVPLGPPIANVGIALLDENLAPVPLGSYGEIVFSGVCVGLGYVNDPERTAAAFIDDPHDPGARRYRSGDLGRWTPEGKLEFLGRRDTQIKMRGFRIEIGEIDDALLRVPGVRDGAVVVGLSPDGSEHLVAFYTASGALEARRVREVIAETLPHYMIPSSYHRCTSLPLTANSKIDRKALTARAAESLSRPIPETTVVTDKTPAERRTATLWASVLGIDASGISPSDTFLGLGGTSLTAVKLVIASGASVSLEDVLTGSLSDVAASMSTTIGVTS